ncbi:MAG TPA: hypothetical protein VE987_21615 [Polyangiaceae bacterium]|nr:hypothetical protein [Polyangiaceae bacterium]
MYRDASLSLEETIARLEAEVRELRALGGKQRERRLVVTAIVCMMIAIHAIIGCVATKVQADRFLHEASRQLGGRTSDLVACLHRLDARDSDLDACRSRVQDCAAAP